MNRRSGSETPYENGGQPHVTIEVYSKEGCGICESAKEKLERMGLPYQVYDLERFVQPHEGWRDDRSVDLLVAYTLNDRRLPVIRIDDEYHDYPSAMKHLKGVYKEKRAAAAEN